MRVSGGDLCTKCRSTDRAGRRDQVLLPLPKRNSHHFGDCFFFVRQNLSEARACRASSPSAAGGRCSERGWRSGQNLLPLQGGINFGNRLITLEEAMIYGRSGDIEKASELFNKYYQNALNEYNVDVENGIETYLHKGERMVYRNTKTGKTETIIADKGGYVVTYCANRCHIDYLETLATQLGIALK